MKRIGLAVIGSLWLASASSAQMPGMNVPPSPAGALARFFGSNLAFSASAQVVTGRKTSVMSFAVSGGKVRNEIDMTKLGKIKPQDAADMKQMGMDRMVILALPGKTVIYVMYPALESYFEAPRSGSQAGGATLKTALGNETIDNHPCAKSKLTITDADGKVSEALVWEATDLNDFPIQYQTTDSGETTITTFRDINQSSPDAALFEVPAKYKQYGSMQELIMGNMQRMMQQ